jgi:adenylosuccinate synthase
MNTLRPRSYGICGGAYGDEGKGRIVDNLVNELSQAGEVVVYRDNGGANAGHTVEFPTGERIALHQLPSGVFIKGAVVVLGKEMVIHPGDLLSELEHVEKVSVTSDRAKIKIDELAILSLDTHRAFESVLKDWQSGGKGSTGRGIAPAYADVLLRHPLRMRDLINWDEAKIAAHYDLYAALISGLGQTLAKVKVPRLSGEPIEVGDKTEFTSRLKTQITSLKKYVSDLRTWLADKWQDQSCAFVFEKAQAVGLDCRWGVYPDVTASDTTFMGIFSASEGIIDPEDLTVKAGVIKATYMSSVGTRKLPTLIKSELADRIRKDAHEYGATTKRPRDIAYLDLPALKFFCRVGRLNALILTHMDIVYTGQPIKVCTQYTRDNQVVPYHPDQVFLDQVTPVYTELATWDATKLAAAKTSADLPVAAKAFIKFISQEIGVPVMMITTGPRRDQGVMLEKMI